MQRIKPRLLQKSIENKLKQKVVSHSVAMDRESVEHQRRSCLYSIQGIKDGESRGIVLNKPSRNNVLTTEMIQQLYRHLESYQREESVQIVYLGSRSTEVLSHGLDYRQLYMLLRQGQTEQAIQYIREINALGLYMGQYNKPLLSLISGETKNQAASIWSQTCFAATRENSTLWYDDGLFNYISDCGTSYILSRLKNDIGLYLLLSGEKVATQDILNLDLAYGKAKSEKVDQLGQQMRYELFRYHRIYNYGEISYEEFTRQQLDQLENRFMMYHSYSLEMQDRLNFGDENTRLMMSEIEYKRQLYDYYNKSMPKNSYSGRFGIHDPNDSYNNIGNIRAGIIDKLVEANQKGTLLHLNERKINQYFAKDSLQSIIAHLEENQENDWWAYKTLQQINRNSKKMQQIMFRLIKEAGNKQWQECYQMEFRVNMRLVNEKGFVDNLERRMKGDNRHEENGWISEQELEGYFRPLDEDLKIDELDGQVLENSLYPVKQYYLNYPDAIRFYINQRSMDDYHQRQGSIDQVRKFLLQHHFDIRNVGMNTKMVRQAFYNREWIFMKVDKQRNRIKQIIDYYTDLDVYYKEREQYIVQQFKEDSMQARIDRLVEQIFDSFYQKRMDKVDRLQDQIRLKQKRKFFKRLKLTAFKHRFTTSLRLQSCQDYVVTNRKQMYLNLFDGDQSEEIKIMNRIFKDDGQQKMEVKKNDWKVSGKQRLQNMRYDYNGEQKRLRKQLRQQIKKYRKREKDENEYIQSRKVEGEVEVMKVDIKDEKVRDLFEKVYKNQYGLQKDVIDSYVEQYIGIAKKDQMIKKKQLKQLRSNLHECLRRSIRSHVWDIRERKEIMEKKWQKMSEDYERSVSQDSEEMSRINREIQEIREKQYERKKGMEILINDNSRFKKYYDMVLGQKENHNIEMVQKSLLALLEEILGCREDKYQVDKKEGQKMGSIEEWLDRCYNRDGEKEKIRLFCDSIGFTFGYLGMMYMEGLYSRYMKKGLGQIEVGDIEEIDKVIGHDSGFKCEQDLIEYLQKLNIISNGLSQMYMDCKKRVAIKDDRIMEMMKDYDFIRSIDQTVRDDLIAQSQFEPDSQIVDEKKQGDIGQAIGNGKENNDEFDDKVNFEQVNDYNWSPDNNKFQGYVQMMFKNIESSNLEDNYKINKRRKMNVKGESISDSHYEANWHVEIHQDMDIDLEFDDTPDSKQYDEFLMDDYNEDGFVDPVHRKVYDLKKSGQNEGEDGKMGRKGVEDRQGKKDHMNEYGYDNEHIDKNMELGNDNSIQSDDNPEYNVDSDVERKLMNIPDTSFYNLGFHDQDTRFVKDGAYFYLRKLDRLMQRAVVGEYDCVPLDMIFDQKQLEIPKVFEDDMRQTTEEFMEKCMNEVIENIFKIRLNNEQCLTRQELFALDQIVQKYFDKEVIQRMVINKLRQRVNQLQKVKSEMYGIEYNIEHKEYKDFGISQEKMDILYRKLALLMTYQSNMKKTQQIYDNIEYKLKLFDQRQRNKHGSKQNINVRHEEMYQERLTIGVEEMDEDLEDGLKVLEDKMSGYDYERYENKQNRNRFYRQALLDSLYVSQGNRSVKDHYLNNEFRKLRSERSLL